jgi:hypothetical protein
MARPEPVDQAMRERRPAKDIMRGYWADEYSLRLGAPETVPVYLTLPGAEGLDIRFLQERGLVGRTQVGGIPADDSQRLVAIERSSDAVLQLQDRLPGLKILSVDIRDLLRGDNQTRFPDSEQRVACRSLIVNLDLNAPLKAILSEQRVFYPTLAMISKLSKLHAEPPVIREWSLLLTLHAAIEGPTEAWESVRQTIAENCRRVEEFRVDTESLMPQEVVEWIGGAQTDTEPPRMHGRKLMMAFVPKRIVELARTDGWSVETSRNVHYPGAVPSPGMLSWIFRFRWDPRTETDPGIVYHEGIAGTLRNIEHLDV